MPSTYAPVALITGASRGIGRALALGLAADGWDIVVAAKSVESREHLPGSIHSVAAEVEALGRRALPIQVDVRDESQIHHMIQRTADTFGRVDLLVNNAGALFWKPVTETPLKRFDLVMGVNVRAAFACAQAVLPLMAINKKGLVVNMSPPLDAALAPGRVAYAISKLGMTLLTHGLAEEVRQLGIRVNSLWPVTLIESQASINHALGTRDQWRKPDILVDAVRHLVVDDCTGRAVLDEDYLRERGVDDFAAYACVPGSRPRRVSWSDYVTH
jgi:citronellol/citronellal dehydrogenase